MALKTLVTMSSNIYFDSAWELYKFLISMATGVLVAMVWWYYTTGRNCLEFGVTAITILLGIIIVLHNHFKNKKIMDEEDACVAYKGFPPTKRNRARRDDDDRKPKRETTKQEKNNGAAQDSESDSVASLKDLPVVVPEPPKKNSRRQKKRNSLKPNKSKYKGAMDDSSETSSVKDSNTKVDTYSVEKTKVYSPLPVYLKLNLELYDLYHEFKPYLLTKEQLQKYGFPRESLDYPGRIITDPKSVKGSTKRHCCRCGVVFYVQADGSYESESSCRFHTKKQVPFQGEYPCCNGNYMSEGCATWHYHVSAESFLHDVDFVKARNKRHLNEVTACTVYALDCEMLYTTAGMEVAKVGIVGVDGLTVFESFVLPEHQVLDYNTMYSGVTEKDLIGVSTTLEDVQAYLLKLLNKDSILVGHGLENDLKVLRFIHEKIVDTSVAFPYKHSNNRYRKSLKLLATEFLHKSIQTSVTGHDCIEDARTCMELMLLKISNDLKERLPLTQDENKNSILQNMEPEQPYVSCTVIPDYSWPYSCNYSYYSDSFGDNFYSGYLMPKKNYQKSCIY